MNFKGIESIEESPELYSEYRIHYRYYPGISFRAGSTGHWWRTLGVGFVSDYPQCPWKLY